MKFIAICLTCLVIYGCGYIQLKPGTEELVTKVTALNVGAEFAERHPEMIDESIKYCDALLKSNINFDYLFGIAKMQLIDNIGDDPVQQASIQMVLDSITVDGDIDINISKDVITSFKTGLLLRK